VTSEAGDQIAGPADQIEDQAAQFLARRRFAHWQANDQAELDTWLSASLSHRVAFWRLEATLARTERLAALQTKSKETVTEPTKRDFRLRFAGMLAVAVIGVVASSLYFGQARPSTYTTPVGGHEILTLADGSVIELNTDTVLRLAADNRSAVLEKGEAFFQIKHNALHPFTVKTSSHRVVDVGTKFLVRSNSRQFEISLIEGLARVESMTAGNNTRSKLLKAGDVAVDANGALIIEKKSETTIARELGWRRGVLVFDNTTLADAAAEFNRYNHTKLVIDDPAVGRMKIGATFPANDVDRFARATRVLLGVAVSRRNGNIVISR